MDREGNEEQSPKKGKGVTAKNPQTKEQKEKKKAYNQQRKV